MNRIIASRGTGKSTNLLRMALLNHADISVHSVAAIRSLALIARDVLNIRENEIVKYTGYIMVRDVQIATIDHYVDTSYNFGKMRPLYVDELETCLQKLFLGRKVAGYTISLEDLRPWED